MATLPTITVTDAQAARLIAVFGDAATYQAWLKETLVTYVLRKEADALYQQHFDDGMAEFNI